MANLKDIRTRISSVKKTKQITSAMKLVAAARLKKATDRALQARPYREQLGAVLERVAAAAGDDIQEPLLVAHPQVKRVLIAVLTTDRGLCGPFNNGLLRACETWMRKREKEGVEIVVRSYGRKGQGFFKRNKANVVDQVTDYARTPKMDLVKPLTAAMVASFVDADVDEVYLVYNKYVSTLVQRPTFDRVLPVSVDPSAEAVKKAEDASNAGYRYEPGAAEILSTLLPLFLQTRVLGAFFETEAGELAARMTAMDSATRNASDLIDRLTLEYNRARQAAITKEIIEIVSGAAAL